MRSKLCVMCCTVAHMHATVSCKPCSAELLNENANIHELATHLYAGSGGWSENHWLKGQLQFLPELRRSLGHMRD